MQLAVIKREEGLRAQLEYNPDIYDAATIRAVLENYENYPAEPRRQSGCSCRKSERSG